MYFWGAMYFYAILAGVVYGWALDTLLDDLGMGAIAFECWLIASTATIIVLPQVIELIVATHKEPGLRRQERNRSEAERLRDKARWDAAAQHHLAVSRQKFVESLFN